ncbi:Glycosyltransferase Type 1 [Halomicronema hongdechloris C2206]|uniref:Glycosyltransferase Type 1 n=1 Tax=Halomicronema hongdechloris C2206 TaxID=1641165 RepID=A0A1Z3HS56_9CYAN|nr:glycosyltransferase [Halomicronema hongdechloris]ASC72957.1 Glycosyltransferase Type 1 [Halomicronema hongdechloris C2206]
MKVLAWPAFKTRYKNPYPWLLYTSMVQSGVTVEELSPRRLLTGRYDIIHIHWPVETIVRHPRWSMALLRMLLFMGLLHWARWREAQVVWTIHDEQPHVLLHPGLAHWCQSLLVHRVDATITLCQVSQQRLPAQLPELADKPSFVIPHGHYRQVYANQISKTAAKDQLGIPDSHPTLLFLGYISPYKNVPQLITTFRQIQQPDIALVVAGHPDDEPLRTAIEQAAGDDGRVRLHLRFIADDGLQVFFQAADLVVLPFQAILNSGSVLLALSFDRPVLVPHLGAMPEWQQQLGTTWVETYEGPLTAERLEAALMAQTNAERPRQAPLDWLDWSVIGDKTLDVYRQLCRS